MPGAPITPFLLIESEDEEVLSLPWELVRIDDRFPVELGQLDVARSFPLAGAQELPLPGGHLGLNLTFAAPRGVPTLNYEVESYRILRALSGSTRVVVNEMGEVDDLVRSMQLNPAPEGIHFSGHGGPGSLLFENEFGDGVEVRALELLERIRDGAGGVVPRFFYLSNCYGATPESLLARRGRGEGKDRHALDSSATALELHRSGVTQVVAYFGPVLATLATQADEAFYVEIGRGRRTRDAVRAARRALLRPAHEGDRVPPFAWAQIALFQRGPDHPLSERLDGPGFIERLPETREYEDPAAGPERQVLRTGFVGRRRELHDLRRRYEEGRMVTVLQGLGGLGKTALADRVLRVHGGDRLPVRVWLNGVEKNPDPANETVSRLVETLSDVHPSTSVDGVATWQDLNAGLERSGASAPHERMAQLLAYAIDAVPAHRLNLYLDNLESLMTGPESDEPREIGEWLPGAGEVWDAITQVSEAAGQRLNVVASSRYVNDSVERYVHSIGPMAPEALFRLMGWFPGLRRLSTRSRSRLVDLLHGHPRAVEYLDKLVAHRWDRWEARRGNRPAALDDAAIENEWQEIVDPVLPDLEDQITANLLLREIWQRVLTEGARDMLVRLTVLRRPCDLDLLEKMAGEVGEASAENLVAELLWSSLVTQLREWVADDERGDGKMRELIRYDVHPSVRSVVTEQAGDRLDGLQVDGHAIAGRHYDETGMAERSLIDAIDAVHHLFHAGEKLRAVEIEQVLGRYFEHRGELHVMLGVLAPFVAEGGMEGVPPREQPRIHTVMGQAHMTLGDLAAAEREFATSLEIAQELVSRQPDNSDMNMYLALSHERTGDLAWARGDLDGAERSLRAVLEIAERFAAQDPTNAAWQRELSVSHSKMGDLAIARGDLDGSERSYRADLGIAQRLAAQDAANAGRQLDLSVSHNKFGDLAIARGDLAGAEQSYRAALEIVERLAAQDPTNARWQLGLSVSHGKIGDLTQARGDLDGAERSYRAELGILEHLTDQDPANADLQLELGVSHNQLGVLAVKNEDPDTAARHLIAAAGIAGDQLARSQAPLSWIQMFIVSRTQLLRLIDTESEDGRERAKQLLTENLELLRSANEQGLLTETESGWIANHEDMQKELGEY